jgi:hypothetical protein
LQQKDGDKMRRYNKQTTNPRVAKAKGGMVDKRNKASKEFFKFAKGEKPRVKK